MLIDTTQQATQTALSLGSVVSASGAVILVLVSVIRDQFKKQNQTFENLINEVKTQIEDLRKEIRSVERTASDRQHDLEVRVTRMEATLLANGCVGASSMPECHKTK